MPPWAAAEVTERLRDCAPVAQEAVHVDQAPKVETTQCAAHAWTLQLRDSSRYGHT